MIGNDLIDFDKSSSKKRAGNSRYLQKAFTNQEREYIVGATDPEFSFWKLWSMKEAAYKCHQRIFKKSRKLNPQAFECRLNPFGVSGTVVVEDHSYAINIDITENFIHSTIGVGTIFTEVYSSSSISKDIMLELISEKYHIPLSGIQLYKDSLGIPYLDIKNIHRQHPISISHDGKFFGFAIPLINS